MNTLSIYSHLPVIAQNILCSLKGWQLERQRYGGEYLNMFHSLVESDTWCKEKILAYKEEHIERLLTQAYRHCPYYKHRFDQEGLTPKDFTCLDDLQKFPVLTKEDIRQNWRGMISDKYSSKQLIPYHTSGSTGKALDFFWTRENLLFYWAVVWRGRHRFGINKGDLHLNFTGKLVVPITQRKPPFWRYNLPLRQYMLNMQHLTREKIAPIVKFINETGAIFFVGYPSIINSLALLIQESNMAIKSNPRFIFTSAEKVYNDQRKRIEAVFAGSKIIEHYGFSENAACASKCIKNHYHEDFELGHLELLSPQQTIDGDYSGRLLASSFHNDGFPFIRYEIGDTATFTSTPCTCGLQSQVIKEIEGRNEDYVVTPEGTKIMRFDYIFKDATSIRECQVVQREPNSIVLRIVRRNDYSEKAEKSLLQEIKEKISPTLQVSFEYVDTIPRTKAGKFKAVLSELK